MSLETAARVADWIERELDRVQPEKFVADVLRRRAAAEPAGDVLPGRAAVAALPQARGVPQVDQHHHQRPAADPEVVDRLLPFGLSGVKITLDGDRDTHNRMRPLRGGQGTFDRIIENIRRVAGQVPDRDRRQLRRELGRQLSGAARLPARAGLRRPAGQGQLQADHQGAGAGSAEGRHPADAGRRRRQAAERHLHDVGRRRRRRGSAPATRATSLDEKMTFLREETQRHGFPTPDGVHNGPVPRPHARTPTPSVPTARSTPAPASPARRRSRPATSTDAQRRAAAEAPRPLRRSSRVEGVRRLRVHPGLRGRLHGGRAHRAWRHERAQLSQTELRSRASSRWPQRRRAR